MPAYVHKNEHFEGPLELLLTLITDRKLSVNDIALAEVTDGYLEYLQQTTVPLEEMAQFVVVASTLLLIKSRALLPTLDLTDDEERSIDDLKERLAHYQRIRAQGRVLRRLWGKGRGFFPRKQPYVAPLRFNPNGVSLLAIHGAMQKIVTSLPSSTFAGKVAVAPTVSLHEMIKRLESRIMSAAKTSFSQLTHGGNRADIILQFLALLELVKSGLVFADQTRTFDDIVIESQDISTPRFDTV